MSTEEKKRLKSGFTEEERKRLRAALNDFASRTAKDYGHPIEAVVQEIRYWQQSSSVGRTNPTAKEKRVSFAHWGERCLVCHETIASIAAATFHHEQRGIPNLHGPHNMKPLHRDEDKGCHEELHNAPPGAFTAGSLRKKPRTPLVKTEK